MSAAAKWEAATKIRKWQGCVAGSEARKQVSNGESPISVANAHGIDIHSKAFGVLQMIVVKGRAGDEVRDGGNCIAVANKYGIKIDSKAFRELEKIAVNGLAGDTVLNGRHAKP